MRRNYKKPKTSIYDIGMHGDVLQLITGSKGTETYDDGDDADEPALVHGEGDAFWTD